MGDKWSLLVLRDISLFNKRTYSDLQGSEEGIATNILADRLKKLEEGGIISKKPHPADKRKRLYFLTERGLDLIPLLLEMILWSVKYDPNAAAPEDFVRAIKSDREEVIREIVRKNTHF